MKNQIHLSSRSEPRRGNARSIICQRGCAWPVLLLAGCCAVLTGLAQPVRAAVAEAWVHRYNNVVSNSTGQAVKDVRNAACDIIVTGDIRICFGFRDSDFGFDCGFAALCLCG